MADYVHQLAAHSHQQGATHLTVLLDRNSTHGAKMRRALVDSSPLIPVTFLYVAAYSPRLNPVEYLIHLIRQALLHHADPAQNLQQVQQRLHDHVHQKVWFSPDQLSKLLAFIDQSVP